MYYSKLVNTFITNMYIILNFILIKQNKGLKMYKIVNIIFKETITTCMAQWLRRQKHTQ